MMIRAAILAVVLALCASSAVAGGYGGYGGYGGNTYYAPTYDFGEIEYDTAGVCDNGGVTLPAAAEKTYPRLAAFAKKDLVRYCTILSENISRHCYLKSGPAYQGGCVLPATTPGAEDTFQGLYLGVCTCEGYPAWINYTIASKIETFGENLG